MMHVIRFSENEHLSEHLSWHLFGCLRRKRIGCLKAVHEVRKGGFVTVTLRNRKPSVKSVAEIFRTSICIRRCPRPHWRAMVKSFTSTRKFNCIPNLKNRTGIDVGSILQ